MVKGHTFYFHIFKSLPPHTVNDISHSQRFIYHLFVIRKVKNKLKFTKQLNIH